MNTIEQQNVTTVLQTENKLCEILAYQGTSLRSFIQFSHEAGFRTSQDIVSHYETWVAEPLYLSFQEARTEYYHGTETTTRKYSFSLASKRGNEIYNKRCLSRFNETDAKIPDIQYFDDNEKHGMHKTKSLFITLTYDPKKITQPDTWLAIGKDFNLFLANLRKRYGKGISQIRSWESHKSGYPHIHCLIYFSKKEFLVHWHVPKKKGKSPQWRLNWQTKEKIANMWKGGKIVDIFGVYNSKLAFHYLGKYLYKYLTDKGSKATLTRAMTWYHRKRAFSLSTDFYPDDLNTLSITQTKKNRQITIEGDKLTIYETIFIGCVVIVDTSKKKIDNWLQYSEKELPDELEGEIRELERRLYDDANINHSTFQKIQTGSVMSLEQVRSFFSGP